MAIGKLYENGLSIHIEFSYSPFTWHNSVFLQFLQMFHFYFLFLPVFGKFQGQAADSLKRVQFAF